jgi:hypothetical protein
MSNPKRCGTCARGWKNDKIGKIACGAPVDEDALRGSDVGVNPIWAERKYDPRRIAMIAANDPKAAEEPIGSDCENMDPSDGADCKMWEVTGE